MSSKTVAWEDESPGPASGVERSTACIRIRDGCWAQDMDGLGARTQVATDVAARLRDAAARLRFDSSRGNLLDAA
jgi:hypothetical protein